MEKTIEGWIVKDLNGIHIFETKPRKERFTQQSNDVYVGYEIDYTNWLNDAINRVFLNDGKKVRLTINVEKI